MNQWGVSMDLFLNIIHTVHISVLQESNNNLKANAHLNYKKNIFLCIFTDLALSYHTPIDLSAPSSNFSLLLMFVSSLSSLPLLFCHVCVCVCVYS